MPFLARCPDCEHQLRAQDKDVGRIVACLGCRSAFVVERDPSDEPVELQPSTAPTVTMRTERTQPSPVVVLDPPAAPSGVVESLPILVEYTPKPTPAPARFTAPDYSDRAGPGPGVWALAGIACLCAVGAGLSASITSLCFLVIPLAVVGLLLGGTAALFFIVLGAVRLELAVPGIPTAGSLVVLGLALFAPDYLSPQYEASRKRPDYDSDAIRYMPTNGELVDPATLVPVEGWADARKMACLQGSVQIEVVSAVVGPVELTGAKPPFTKERYLAITLRIHHLGHGKAVPFAAWGATAPRTVPDAKLTAGGKPVGLASMGGRTVSGMLYNGLELTPASSVSTKLIFDVPPSGEALRLELPAEAWSGRGSFKFSIPASMISGATAPKAK